MTWRRDGRDGDEREESPALVHSSSGDDGPESGRDLALVVRSQHGDRAAFNVFVERYQAGAYALALRMVGDPETAADITQDAFFSAFRAIGAFRGSSFRAWLFRIVSNGCYDFFRARTRRPATSLEGVLEDERETSGSGGAVTADVRLPQALIDPTWDPEVTALRAETAAQIEAALLKLPAEQRVALVLSDVQGLAYDEIAGAMNCSLGTVKSRIFRARTHLRALLTREGELFSQGRRPESGRENE
jgi:RNA polymerase sigma factor (sigma-70 family)